MKIPSLSIFDPDGYLPLNLQRTEIIDKNLPFQEELLEDIWRDFLAFLLVNAPQTPDPSVDLQYSGINTSDYYPKNRWPWFWLSSSGLALSDPWNYKEGSPTQMIMSYGLENSLLFSSYPKRSGIIPFRHGSETAAGRQWFRISSGHAHDDSQRIGPMTTLRCTGRRVMLNESWYKELRGPGVVAQKLWNSSSTEFKKNGWVLMRFGKCTESSFPFDEMAAKNPESSRVGIAEWYIDDPPVNTFPISSIAELWRELIELPYIPYDLDERKKVLKSAYEILSVYVDAHERLKAGAEQRKTPKKSQDMGLFEFDEEE